MNNPLLFLGNVGTTEFLIILFVILLLFGGRKIPELMRGLGKGVRSFKEGMNEVESEINKPVEKPKQNDGDTQK
ncbi:MAG: twin-arginine translocase TatA/TatE family subunit [Muribaculaceae bacterium]